MKFCFWHISHNPWRILKIFSSFLSLFVSNICSNLCKFLLNTDWSLINPEHIFLWCGTRWSTRYSVITTECFTKAFWSINPTCQHQKVTSTFTTAHCVFGLILYVLDFGLWTTDFGLRTLDYGLWTSDFGLRTTNYGLEECSP